MQVSKADLEMVADICWDLLRFDKTLHPWECNYLVSIHYQAMRFIEESQV